MIIWSRWGILALPFVGLGIGLGFLLKAVLLPGTPSSGPGTSSSNGVFVGIGLVLGAAALWAAVHFLVGKVIDKPRAAMIYEKLPEPVRTENGAVQTHRAIPVVHPETGQQIVTQPTSSLFFIPVKYLPYVLAAIGVVVFIISLIGVLANG
jgi:hypothetical protein